MAQAADAARAGVWFVARLHGRCFEVLFRAQQAAAREFKKFEFDFA